MDRSNHQSTATGGWLLILGFAFAKLLLHILTNLWGGYGIFRDELYYVACSNHLDIGYVDQPPLSIFVLTLTRLLIGDSVFAIRLLPALAGAATVILTGRMVRQLGGNTFAVILACLASIVSLANLGYDTVYSMNAFDVLFWTAAEAIVIHLIKTGDANDWLSLGIVLGIGSLNKIDILWLGAGIGVGFLLTTQRSWLPTRWPWFAAAMTLVLFSPYVLWNFSHDFAHLEFIRNATAGKYSSQTPETFAVGQILVQNPVTLPVWLAGLIFSLFSKRAGPVRPLAFAYLAIFGLLIWNGHSKPEYLSPAYAFLFAAGGVALEALFSWKWLGWMKPISIGGLGVGIILAPIVLPVLPVTTYIAYADLLNIRPMTAEGKQLGQLPQFYADMFGWEEKAAAVSKVYHQLPAPEQLKCAIFAGNYGRCGAIDYWGKKYGLPPAIGNHNNYWLWGPGEYSGDLMIVLGGTQSSLQAQYREVECVDTVTCGYCMPYENNLPIYLCRDRKAPLIVSWPRMKSYD